MGTFRVSELAKVARSTSVEAFERLLGPLVLVGPPDVSPSSGVRRFHTQDGTAQPGPLRQLLDGVAHPVRKLDAGWPTPDGERVVLIGRAEPNDVRIVHGTISKFHAHIRGGPDGLELVDASSTNGTFYDGEPVAPGDAVRLEDGHQVRLGDVHLEVFDPAHLHRVLAGVALSPYHERRSG